MMSQKEATMSSKESFELPLVSVGILNFNRKDELRVTITKVLESYYPALEIIVVDNGSSDGSVEMVKSEFPDVKLHELGRNIGIVARNIILFKAIGKYIILYDDDSMPSTSLTIREIVDFLEQHTNIAALCTNIINYYTGVSETQGWEKYALANYNEYYEGLFIHASGMAYRRDSIRQTRGFPENFFFHLEEGDLTLQLLNKNLKIAYKPDIITSHRRSPIHRDEPWTFLMATRNGIWLFWKYFPFSLALWFTSRYIFKQAVMTMGRPSYLLSFFKGVFLGIRGIPTQWRERAPLSKEAISKTKGWQCQNLSLSPYRKITEVLKQQLLRRLPIR